MLHRHLTHERFTLAAIDDVISRGKWLDWAELRRAALDDRETLEKISRVCQRYDHDPCAQRYRFWQQFALKTSPEEICALRELLASSSPAHDQFEQTLPALERLSGIESPVSPAPGCLDGIETSVRELSRSEPLELESFEVGGRMVSTPSEREILRIWAVQILTQNRTADYLCFASLFASMEEGVAADAFVSFDRLYPLLSGESALQQLLAQLACLVPCDVQQSERQPSFPALKNACAAIAAKVFDRVCVVGDLERSQA